MCYYFGLRRLFLLSLPRMFVSTSQDSIMANLFGGEPPTFYTSQEYHQLNTRLPDCCICSTVIETSRHQYAHSHNWFAISRTVPWSCIQSGELGVADSLQSWTRMGKGCILAWHWQISVASQRRGRAKVPVYLCVNHTSRFTDRRHIFSHALNVFCAYFVYLYIDHHSREFLKYFM